MISCSNLISILECVYTLLRQVCEFSYREFYHVSALCDFGVNVSIIINILFDLTVRLPSHSRRLLPELTRVSLALTPEEVASCTAIRCVREFNETKPCDMQLP